MLKVLKNNKYRIFNCEEFINKNFKLKKNKFQVFRKKCCGDQKTFLIKFAGKNQYKKFKKKFHTMKKIDRKLLGEMTIEC